MIKCGLFTLCNVFYLCRSTKYVTSTPQKTQTQGNPAPGVSQRGRSPVRKPVVSSTSKSRNKSPGGPQEHKVTGRSTATGGKGISSRQERSVSPPLPAASRYEGGFQQSPGVKRKYVRKAESPSPARGQDLIYYTKPRGRPRQRSPEEDEFYSPAGSHILEYFESQQFVEDGDGESDDSCADSTYEGFSRRTASKGLPDLNHPAPVHRGQPRGTPSKKSSYMPRKLAGRRWTIEKIQQLCVLWEEEHHLYDASDPNYKNARMRENSYDRMAAILDMEGT